MSANYVDRVYLNIDGEDIECTSVKRDQDDKSEPVPTMNRENRSKGFKRGVLEYTLDVEFPLNGDYDIDPEKMHEEAEEFTVTIEEEDGKTHEYQSCRFKKVSVDSKEGDSTKYSATIMCLDRVST